MFDKCVSDVSTNSSVSNFYHPQSSSWNPFLDPNESPYLWIGWIAAGVFAAFATFTSSILIIQHWLNYTRPQFQKAYVRILAMVPMYAVCSWVSFRYYKEAIYLNVMRDCYEGFVVYSFYNLCLQYLGSTPAKQRERLARKSRQRLPPPMCCFYFDPSHKHFLSLCKLGIVQYVVVRVTTTFFAVVLESMGMYCNESMSPMFGHFWTTLANAVAMSLAMFTLITFYLAVRKDISRFHPVWQFLSVKFVIFFGFWQSFVIKVLVSAGWIQNSEHWTIEELSISLQSFMTCVEMAIASIIHLWAFRYEDFIPGIGHLSSSEENQSLNHEPGASRPDTDPAQDPSPDDAEILLAGSRSRPRTARVRAWWKGFLDAINWSDVIIDVGHSAGFIIGRLKRIFGKLIFGRRYEYSRYDSDIIDAYDEGRDFPGEIRLGSDTSIPTVETAGDDDDDDDDDQNDDHNDDVDVDGNGNGNGNGGADDGGVNGHGDDTTRSAQPASSNDEASAAARSIV